MERMRRSAGLAVRSNDACFSWHLTSEIFILLFQNTCFLIAILENKEAHIKQKKKYNLAQLDEIDAVACSCGQSRRAFFKEESVASVHLVDIREDARPHYHKKRTEIYIVLDGRGWIELDGERIPVRPMSAVKINHGCRHRAVGRMRILNAVIPAFDPEDEWFDEQE